jgi:hypothetical protein
MHIFTGAKGGVGKTLLALSAAVTHLNHGRVLLIDLNWENADLSRIMRLHQPPAPSPDSKFRHNFICDRQGLVMSPLYSHTLPSAALGFWESLRQALRESRDVHQFSPDFILVDTGLHFASLLRQTSWGTIARVTKRIATLVRENQIAQLNLWYIWTFASMVEEWGDLAYIDTVLNYFGRHLENDYFDIARNVIHVLNPYALYPQVVGNQQEIRFFSKLANAQAGPGIIYKHPKGGARRRGEIDLFDFVMTVRGEFDRQKRPMKLIEDVGEGLLKRCGDKRPYNLFPIPLYDPNVVGFTDGFVQDPPGHINDVGKVIGVITAYIQKYIDVLMRPRKA